MDTRERCNAIFAPLEGAEVAARIANSILMFQRRVLPAVVGKRMIDHLIAKHGIVGPDKTWLENVRDTFRE